MLIAQNRTGRQMERRHHLDLQINLLAEQSGALTLRLLRRMCERLGIEVEDVQPHRIDDLLSDQDLENVLREIDRRRPSGVPGGSQAGDGR